ncbi:MAG: type III pantothenate kinase [Rikenellaceae bacterium]
MNLVIDIGNTLAKAAVVDNSVVVDSYSGEELGDLPLQELVAKYSLRRSILCSTRGCGEVSAAYVRDIVGDCILLNGDVSTPLQVKYDRQMLGRDRLAAAVGAYSVYGGETDLMVVDFGTAITIDFISSDGVFEGGFISPGLSTRFRALHDYTARLPLCSAEGYVEGVATTTQDAIMGGVVNGIAYEIEGYIRERNEKKCNFLVIFSGGDSIFFDKRIKNTIFAGRDILFRGLDTILNYNE